MDQRQEIEVRVSGHVGNAPLTPDNFTVDELMIVLEQTRRLLSFGGEGDDDGVGVVYRMEPGSVRNVFTVSPAKAFFFGSLLSAVAAAGNLDAIAPGAAKALGELQKYAQDKGRALSFAAGGGERPLLEISSQTSLERHVVWADSEYVFYGVLVAAGGKGGASIRLDTDEWGVLTIAVDRGYLAEQTANLLYRPCGVVAAGRENVVTGELDRASLRFVEIIEHGAEYDPAYLQSLISKASPNLDELDVAGFMAELRGEESYV